jgi:hypothetical protein
MLKTCMYPHDVEEVLKLCLSDRNPDDHIAWHYERSGIITVKSAYKLAKQSEQEMVGSTSRSNGGRSLYNEIWKANVPPKVRIFVWRLAQDGLATQLVQ